MSETTQESVPEPVFESNTRLISEAIGQQIAHQLEEASLGVMIESPPDFDPKWLIDSLNRTSDYTIGLSLVNLGEVDIEAVQAQSEETGIRVDDSLSTAIQWRNQEETEFSWDDRPVPDRIVVLVRGDPARLNSLHRLVDIPLGAIRSRIAQIMQEQPAFEDSEPALELWQALGEGVGAHLSLEAIATYSVNTHRSSSQKSIEALGVELYHLGLLRDSDLFTDAVENRLKDNHELVNRILHLTNRDRRRLMNSIQKESESTQEDQAELVELIRRFQRTHDDSLLTKLEYKDVKETLQTTSQTLSRAPSESESQKGDTEGTTSLDASSSKMSDGQNQRYTRRHDDSAVGVELTFDDRSDEVESLVDDINEKITNAIDREESRVEITYGSSNKAVIDLYTDYYHFVSRFVANDIFGGIVRDIENRSEAIESVGSFDTQYFQIDDEESNINRLRDFATREEEFQPVVDALDRYVEHRAKLIDHLAQILHSPLLCLLGDEDLLKQSSEYLDSFQELQNKLDKKYRTLQNASPRGASQLLSEFLLLDTIVLETASGREMILSPLHPLHLWKYIKLAENVTANRDSLSEEERQFLVSSVEEQPHVLNNVTIGGGQYLPNKTYLIQSDELGTLPVYTETDRAEPGQNNELWDYLLEKFTSGYPPARSNLRLSIIDPIDPSDILAHVSRAAQANEIHAATIEFCFINSTQRNILRGATSAEEEDILEVFGPRSDFDSFTVKTKQFPTYERYCESLEGNPQHCIVINDHGTFSVEEFERDRDTAIHPLYVPKEFSYDALQNEIDIRASTEGKLFSEYQDLINQLFNQRQSLHDAGVHSLQVEKDDVEQFLDKSIWCVVSAPATNLDPFWVANLISKERRGDRNYGIYSHDFELFTRTLRRLLSEYPIAPEEVDISRLADRIAELQHSGLLRLITEETLGQERSRNTQGLLGSVIAVQWLEERFEGPKLIFSIDDPRTRRWLNFGDSNRRADFVVTQFDETNGLDLSIVEVKTLSEPSTAFQIDQSQEPPLVKGDAIDQVTKTVSTIRELFEGEDNITTAPRREALREQLYYELVGSEVPGNKGEWTNRINNVFRGDSELTVRPHVVSVEITSGDTREPEIECTTDEAQSVAISRLPRQTIVRLIMNGSDASVKPTISDGSSEDETSSDDSESAEGEELTFEEPETQTDGESSELEPDVVEDDIDEEPDQTEPGDRNDVSEDTSETGSRPESFGSVEDYADQAEQLKLVLSDFGIRIRDIPHEEVDVGPNVIRYKVRMSPDEEHNQIRRRSEDIAREMALEHEPIVHHIKGTHFVAIDVPRTDRQVVNFSDYLDSLPDSSEISVGELPYIVGIEPSGNAEIANLQDAPHMLVGGATGSGKTVFLRTLLACILERQPIENTEIAIVDPKQTDFIFCNSLPNLKTGGVITESSEAHELFDWIVEDEIPRRTEVLTESQSVDIQDHNERSEDPMRPLIVIIDEYADLLDSLGEDGDEFETQVRRIAQRARNVGIHLIVATQRPSAQIINTDLRSNLNVRVGFRVPSASDSQVILDDSGAEGLVGQGDMLYKETDDAVRLQGTFIEPNELRDLVQRVTSATYEE